MAFAVVTQNAVGLCWDVASKASMSQWSLEFKWAGFVERMCFVNGLGYTKSMRQSLHGAVIGESRVLSSDAVLGAWRAQHEGIGSCRVSCAVQRGSMHLAAEFFPSCRANAVVMNRAVVCPGIENRLHQSRHVFEMGSASTCLCH